MPIVATSWLYRILAGALAIAALLWLIQSRNHWKDTATLRQQQVVATKAAFDQTVANYRAAADQSRKADAANVERVKADQAAINERTSDDFEKRIADARARAAAAERMRSQGASTAGNSGSHGTAAVSGVPVAPTGSAEAAGQGGLPAGDQLTATEQAIQLDELIRWIKQQAGVQVSR